MTLLQVEQYTLSHAAEIRKIMGISPAFGFLCAAAYIDFLSKLYTGVDKKDIGYIEYIETHFPAKYKSFKFKSKDYDLPLQIYTIFRCGILHSFSLTPDKVNRNGKKMRTVVISHDGKYGDKTYSHLEPFLEDNFDAAVLIGANLCDDIESSIKSLFSKSTAFTNVHKRLQLQPPLSSIYLEIYKNNLPAIELDKTLGNAILVE